MNILRKIKKEVADFVLRKDSKKVKRTTTLVNFKDAKEIGILYFVKDKSQYNSLSKFVGKLQEDDKNVKAIVLADSEHLKNQIMPKLSYDLFTSKNLNWFNKPSGAFVNDFLKREFDILINFDKTDSYSINYLLALSKSKLKVGYDGNESAKHLDVMIKVEEKSNFNKFAKELVHYLSILKPKKNEI